jgi:peptidoglycan-N-acetylglucosamine deacetylase
MPKVILTFDDGPEPEHTPRILDILAKENVQAVFFVLGEKLQSTGALDIVRRATSEGHLIGNHTFSHPNLTRLSPEEIRSQIVRTHRIISDFEPKQKLFRPPYGSSNETVKAVVKELNYEAVWWNADSGDWNTENQPSAWVDFAIERIRARRRAICLCHDTGHTADHLPQLLEKVKQLPKYRFARYDHCRTLRRRAKLLGYRLLDGVLG